MVAAPAVLALGLAGQARGAERCRARGRGRQAIRRHRDHDRLGSGPAGARPAQLLGPQVEGADRHRRQRDRGADRRDVHQDPAGASRRHRRLRRAQRDPVVDGRPGPRRRARAARRLCRQVRLSRGARDHRPGLPRQPDEGERRHLRLSRRRRRLRLLLPQGHLRGERARAAQDVAGVRRDLQPADREVCSRDVRGRHVPPEPLSAVPVPGALPGRGRQVLRSRDDEGDDQRRDRGQGADRDARGEQVHAAGRRDLGLRREPRGVPRRRHRDDRILAALRPLGGGLRHRPGGALVGPEVGDRRQGRLRAAAGRASRSSPPASRSRSRRARRTRRRPICSSSG